MSLGRNGQTNRGYLFLGEVLLAERVDLVSADAFVKGFRDRQVQASEQLSHRLFLPAKQHGQSLTPSWATATQPIGDKLRIVIWPYFRSSSMEGRVWSRLRL